jgi:hypothetical protein
MRARSGEIAEAGPIISGLRKADKLISHPYAYFHHALAEELISCRRLLIIGYGGDDYHLNFWIRHLKERWGKDARVAIVTHSDDPRPSFGNTPFAAFLTSFLRMDINAWHSLPETAHPNDKSARTESLAIFWSGFPLADNELENLLLFLAS